MRVHSSFVFVSAVVFLVSCDNAKKSSDAGTSSGDDSGTTDSGTADSGTTDSGTADSGTTDSGTDAGCLATTCGTSCVDTNTDEAHCGGCDAACEPGEVCTTGGCHPPNDALEDAFTWDFSTDGTETSLDATLEHSVSDHATTTNDVRLTGKKNIWYRLVITERTIVFFDTLSSEANYGTDTGLRLTDATGASLSRPNFLGTVYKHAENDDDQCGTGSLDAMLAWTFTTPGTYYLAVNAYNDAGGLFHLREQHVYVDDYVQGALGGPYFDGDIGSAAGNSSVQGTLAAGTPVYDSCSIAVSPTNEQDGFWFASCGTAADDAVISVCTADGGSWTYNGGTDPVLSLIAADTNTLVPGQCIDDGPAGDCAPSDAPTQHTDYGSRITNNTARGLYFVVLENRVTMGGHVMSYSLAYKNTF